MPIIDDSAVDQPVEPFYLKVARLERENCQLTRKLGEKDIENARLRESLQAIAVMAGETDFEIRALALKSLERSLQSGQRS